MALVLNGSNDTITGLQINSANIVDGSIVNADIKSTALIEFSKMENLTASRALVSDSNGDVSASAVTDTEVGYLDGVTSNIQTQINTKTSTGKAIGLALIFGG